MTWNKDRKQKTIWTHEAGTHDTHDRGLTLLSPPKRLVPSLNSSIGEGGWALWRPLRTNTDKNTGLGTSRVEQTDRDHGGAGSSGSHGGAGSSGGHGVARGSGGHGSAGSSGGHGRWVLVAVASVPLARPLQPEPFYPPPKNFPGEVRGYQEPSGARQTGQYKQNRKALQGQTDRTGQPTGTRSPPGLAWKLRLPLGMTWHQGPSQGPSATASHLHDKGQAARMASMATTRGAACPRQVLRGQDRHDD